LDFDGDGQTDWYMSQLGNTDSLGIWRLTLASAATAGRLRFIDDGLGARTTFEYKRLTDSSVYSTTTGCGGYPTQTICAPLNVVSRVVAPGGRQLTYTYKDFRASRGGRGALGIGAVVETDVTRGVRTTTSYRQDFPYLAMPSSIVTALTSGATVATVDFTHDLKELGVSGRTSWFPFPKSTVQKRYEIAPFAGLVATTSTLNTFDDFGNLTSRQMTATPATAFLSPANPSISTTTTDDFLNDEGQWRFELSQRRVTRQRGTDAAKTRTWAFEYEPLRGFLSAIITEPESGALWLRKGVTRDDFGNVSAEIISGPDFATRASCYYFDAAYPNYGRFNTRLVERLTGTDCVSVNTQDHETLRAYDAATGGVRFETDPNGLTTEFQFDDLGRPFLRLLNQGGIDSWTKQEWLPCIREVGCDNRLGDSFIVQVTNAAGGLAVFSFDEVGRLVAKVDKSGDGRLIRRHRQFDSRGFVTAVSSPEFVHLSGGGSGGGGGGACGGRDYMYPTVFTHDALGRVLQANGPVDESTPCGRITRFEYEGLRFHQYDPKNIKTTRERDVAGNVIKVIDAASSTVPSAVGYSYEAFDNLVQVVDAGKSIKTMSYDIRGRRFEIDDPDMGHWTYTHDALGQLKTQTDHKLVTLSFDYDLLGRMIWRDEPEGPSTWIYDTLWKGALSEVNGPGYRRSYTYKPFGAVQTETTEIEALVSAAITQFSATPSVITQAQATTITWAAEAVQCSASGSLPGWTGAKATSGSEALSTLSTGTFEAVLTCSDQYTGSTSAAVAVTVQPAPVVVIDAFSASPTEINEGESTSLAWTTSNAVTCLASGTLPGWAGNKPVDGNQTLGQDNAGDYTATLTCRDVLNRTASQTINVKVHDCLTPLLTCVASPIDLPVDVPNDPTATSTSMSIGDALFPVTQAIAAISDLVEDPCTVVTPSALSDSACSALPVALGTCYGCASAMATQSQLPGNVPAHAYTYTFSYNAAGQLVDLTYPSGLTARYGYSNGVPSSVSDAETGFAYWQAQSWDVWGNPSSVQLGNGLLSQRTYDAAVGDLNAVLTGSLQSDRYAWDISGNLESRANDVSSLSETFQYNDPLDRLQSVSGPGGSMALTYKPNGNIDSRSDLGIYMYGGKPHAVSAIGLSGYQYDDNGNLESGGGRSFTWASFNLPTRVDKGSSYSELKYGPERQRVRQLYETPSESKLIYYSGELYEDHRGASSLESKNLIATPDGIAAVITVDSSGMRGATYLHKDHLGSVVATTDANGGLLERLSYDAFGKRRNANWQGSPSTTTFSTSLGYTGHEHLDAVGLIHMNGRVYDPSIGRFISADPFVPDPTYSQSHNRYSYVYNNPLRYTDPSGYSPEDDNSCCYMIPVDGFDDAASLDHLQVSLDSFEVLYDFSYLQPPEALIGFDYSTYNGFNAGAGIVSGFNSAVQAADSAVSANGAGATDGQGSETTYSVGVPPLELSYVLGLGAAGRAIFSRFAAKEAFHYTTSKAIVSIEREGLRAGSYATPTGTLSPMQAQIDLALSPTGLRDALVRVDLAGLRNAGYEIPPITQVGRSHGMPGGGFEMRFAYRIPPEFISGVRP
jgi:RHS repeat-associated protein